MGLALRFLIDDSGATAIEYGLIAALIAVGAIASFTAMGNSLVNLFGRTDAGAGAVFTEAVSEL
jgi:pilus assembly protein Flp/PilA